MRVPVWAVQLLGWRWMPAVALVMGSLAFVVVAVAVVPDDLGASASDRLATGKRSRLGTSSESTNEATPSSVESEFGLSARARRRASRAEAATPSPDNVVQSRFQPAPDGEPPVAPEPEPAPAAPNPEPQTP